jgi:hypothetical protein
MEYPISLASAKIGAHVTPEMVDSKQKLSPLEIRFFTSEIRILPA